MFENELNQSFTMKYLILREYHKQIFVLNYQAPILTDATRTTRDVFLQFSFLN